ncbi:clathrin adaptor complex, small chain, putative [Entamoeba histolytica HM-1:IMSS-B]|uniref:AP complex subunit sigma n=9 Tax=Entamoeba TaxID=5758 RepID=A0A8U0WPQ7_ENTH1|nr:clathrin adaptor complex, small chain, putative [Entamoeba nuttalli P19]XP_649458.1 Clathrin adaptor complex small chain, putative [Entamoeba histolytica HM-1:IMSS]EMD48731.1 clathrin adaptor complex small chain, putative [Entamoeba histolytica KU27]EMH73315.1 clathrin adaptor complex, small chain, putative [Entamoeba histolytica HM-1:IMSS-B]EMS13414.1 clathrin adaptor complex small chain [Entamoeba histolytica HM-3:IMSS]ENY64667.1 clathrin adaptor complex small chain, putative [Entamoeba h|eukprot:XP_008856403.1 clathrin adaptor complex, small chain, putative [Entamoeba nuttalli P19]
MIKAFIIINNMGKIRLVRFYNHMKEEEQQKVVRDLYALLCKRTGKSCNIISVPQSIWGEKGITAVSRTYATLSFICVFDDNENELFIHSLIQNIVEVLDKCFENVCELDLVFHSDRVHYVLNEFIQAGLILNNDIDSIIRVLTEQAQLEKTDTPAIKQTAINV